MATFTKIDKLKAGYAAKVYKESKRDHTNARGMHYICLNRTDFPLFNKAGQYGDRPYKDSDADIITEWIALAKRQGLIPWDAIRDETVGETGFYEFVPHRQDFSYGYSNSFSYFGLSELRDHLKRTTFEHHHEYIRRDQPYRLEIWVEKNTMNAMLEPICQKYDAGLVTFKGQPSWGSVWNLCERADKDRRPTLVFYLSDLDVYGFLMAHQMAEKVDEINKDWFKGDLDIRVRRVGLTPDQVLEYNIPKIKCEIKTRKTKNGDIIKAPNQDSFDAYVAPYGWNHTEKVELDALEAKYPGGVAGFVENWLTKFYDSTLVDRCVHATTDLLLVMPPYPRVPDEIVVMRLKLLAGLEELIQAESEIAVPDGYHTVSDIEPMADDPTQESWLLSTQDGVYPADGDVDYTREMV